MNGSIRRQYLRDGYFVVNALNRLGATDTMERYLNYFVNVAAGAAGSVFGCVAITSRTA